MSNVLQPRLSSPIGYVACNTRPSAKSDRLLATRKRSPAPAPNWPPLPLNATCELPCEPYGPGVAMADASLWEYCAEAER